MSVERNASRNVVVSKASPKGFEERAKLTAVRKTLRQRAREEPAARAGRSCDVRG